MSKTRLIAATALAASAFGAFSGDALAWRSNEFVSPSGNIHCEFINYGTGVTCMLRHNRRQAVISNTGRGYEVRNWPDPFVTYAYVLAYGREWCAPLNCGRYYCRSFSAAMVCGNRWTGHGFSIAREGIRTW